MVKRKTNVALTYALAISCLGFQSIAQEPKSSAIGKISVLTEHLAPFQIVSENKVEGYSTDIISAVLDHAGVEYSIEALPWSLSFQRAKKEANSCVYSLVRIPQRENDFHWIGKISSSTTSFYSLSGRDIKIEKLDQAQQYVTAVMEDDVAHHFLTSNGFIENESLYVLNNYDALLKLLEMPNRNIDFVILNDDLLAYRLEDSKDALQYQNVYQIRELTMDFYLGCSLNTPDESIKHLTNSMAELEKNGTLTNIRERWQKKMAKKKQR